MSDNSTSIDAATVREVASIVRLLVMVVGVLLVVIALVIFREAVAFIQWLMRYCTKDRKKKPHKSKKNRNMERLSFKNRCFLDSVPNAKELNDRIVNLKIDVTTDDETLAGNEGGASDSGRGATRGMKRFDSVPPPSFANMHVIPLYSAQ